MGGGEGGEERERWSSRVAFIFASVGAAVGFGNVWRFPALAYSYGGGAFFIPYLMALFLIGIPVLVLEYGLGQFHQTGDVGAFGYINPRLRGVGLSSVTNGYFVVCYYCGLVAWVVRAFFDSFKGFFHWENTTGTEAYNYFVTEIVGMGESEYPTSLVGANVGYLALTWIIIWLCLCFGLKWTGRITYFTMGLPIILLFVFLGRALSLPGSSDGVKAYIGQWDMSVLRDKPDCWSTAVSQIFFSIGVTFGIMTAFGSHCERDAPCFSNSCIVAISNSMFSFIAGFAVFGSLGYLAHLEGTDVSEQNVAGPSLVFGAWPVVLATLPGGAHWVRLLFFNLFLLGIDSAFALVEAGCTVLQDSKLTHKIPRFPLAGGLCLFAFLCGLLYCTDTGFLFLDVVDFYVNFIMLLVGFFETFAAGWIYGIEKQIEKLGGKPVITYLVTTFASVILASCLWFGLDTNAVGAGFGALIALYVVGMSITLHFLNGKIKGDPEKWTWKSILYELTLSNVMDLRNELANVVGFLPSAWAILMKHVIAPILILLFINLAFAKTAEGVPTFGNYGGYPAWPYQAIGIFIIILTCITVLLGMAVPRVYECFTYIPDIVKAERDAKKAAGEEEDGEVGDVVA